MIIKELREYDTHKVKSTIIQLKCKILENRFLLTKGELTDISVFKKTRRVIAQLMTILRERNEIITSKDWRDFADFHKNSSENEKSKKNSKVKKSKKVK